MIAFIAFVFLGDGIFIVIVLSEFFEKLYAFFRVVLWKFLGVLQRLHEILPQNLLVIKRIQFELVFHLLGCLFFSVFLYLKLSSLWFLPLFPVHDVRYCEQASPALAFFHQLQFLQSISIFW